MYVTYYLLTLNYVVLNVMYGTYKIEIVDRKQKMPLCLLLIGLQSLLTSPLGAAVAGAAYS